ncbi:MAG: NAD(P)-dependent oxidoreductase [Aggregatilineales bacterium]
MTITNNRTLITGSTGLVGGYAMRRFAHAEGISRHDSANSVDIMDEVALNVWAEGKHYDVIIHLAADIELDTYLPNIQMTLNIARLAQTMQAKLIYVSSISVYGAVESSQIINEDTRTNPQYLYAASKLAGEDIVRLLCPDNHTILRLSSPYGVWSSRKTVLYQFIELAQRGQAITLYNDGKRSQDFIHLDDVVSALQTVMSNPAIGTFNLGSGRATSMKYLARTAISVTSASTELIQYKQVDHASENYHLSLDITRFQKLTGWEPHVLLESGMRQLLEGGDYLG